MTVNSYNLHSKETSSIRTSLLKVLEQEDAELRLSKRAFPVLLGSTSDFNIEGTDILPPSNSQTLAGHPRIQLNSHTTCLDVESDSTGKGFSPTKPPSSLDTSGKSRLLLVLLTQLAVNQMFPQHPPWV